MFDDKVDSYVTPTVVYRMVRGIVDVAVIDVDSTPKVYWLHHACIE